MIKAVFFVKKARSRNTEKTSRICNSSDSFEAQCREKNINKKCYESSNFSERKFIRERLLVSFSQFFLENVHIFLWRSSNAALSFLLYNFFYL